MNRADSRWAFGLSPRVAMSVLGQKQTYALQQAISALHPIATAKADFRARSCPLYPRKRTCAVQLAISAKGHGHHRRANERLLSPIRGTQSNAPQSDIQERFRFNRRSIRLSAMRARWALQPDLLLHSARPPSVSGCSQRHRGCSSDEASIFTLSLSRPLPSVASKG